MLGCVGTCEDSLPPFACHYQAQCCLAILSWMYFCRFIKRRSALYKLSSVLFVYDHTEHIKINLPFYFSLLAAILVTPFLMFFINVSSWNPGDAFVFSFFAHMLLLLVLVPFE